MRMIPAPARRFQALTFAIRHELLPEAATFSCGHAQMDHFIHLPYIMYTAAAFACKGASKPCQDAVGFRLSFVFNVKMGSVHCTCSKIHCLPHFATFISAALAVGMGLPVSQL